MTFLATLETELAQAGISADLLPMASWCLRAIYDGDTAAQMKTDARTLARNGCEWADENKVLASLLAMEGKFVERVTLNEWREVRRVKEPKVAQRELF